MKRNRLVLLGVTASMIFTTGCATLISGKTQTIDVQSKTEKKFKVDGKEYTTPAKVILTRGDTDKIITVDGCEDNVTVKSGMNGMFWGNVLIGGVVGSTTDAISGSAWSYDDNITIDCKKK